ncbi:MAG: TetR/AcrR family transcriptional regulator [Candidatus Glassbacteria bacterium]|nr:TetR/AcrR family transcriptional regulator [Candidatus Glassbacteria bacterium]
MPTNTFFKLEQSKRDRIIAAAVDLFASKGYTRTSMEAVAEAAGIAKGALYRYFKGKKDFFLLVVDHLHRDLDNYAREFIEEHRDHSVFDTIRDHMVSIYQLHERFSVHMKIICNVLYYENLDFKGEVLAKFGKLSTQYTRLVLQRGIARGEVREEVDLDAAAFVIESVVDRFHDGIMVVYLDHGFGLYQAPQEVVDRKADLIMEGFRRAIGKLPPAENQAAEKPSPARKK